MSEQTLLVNTEQKAAVLPDADPDRYASERKRRAADKRHRNRALRELAAKDKRRQKTLARAWISYLRLARDPAARNVPITAAELCEGADISEAAFYRNFAGRPIGDEEGSGLFPLMLAVVDRIADAVIREVRREVRHLEESGKSVDQASRITIAITRLVMYVHRYPHLFHVDGILPRELMYSLSDALADAIIWTVPATLQEKATAVAVAKYHTTALIGIMRSELGKDLSPETYRDRVIYMMISQILPAVAAPKPAEGLTKMYELAAQIAPPLELDLSASEKYEALKSKLDVDRMVMALQPLHGNSAA